MWECVNRCCRRDIRPAGGACVVCGAKVTFSGTVARTLADQLVERLRRACRRIAIAGSIRRGRRRVGDIEIVAEPIDDVEQGQRDLFSGDVIPERTKLDNTIAELITGGELERDFEHNVNGRRQKRFRWSRHSIPVDLFIVRPPATWGVILAIRTGPAEFGKDLVSTLPEGMKICGGQLFSGGAAIPTDDERQLFAAVDLPYVEPADRTAETISHLRRFAGRLRKSGKG